MLRLLIAVPLLLLSLVAPAAATAGVSPEPVKVDAILKEQALAGAVWSTVSADGSIHTAAAGLRDVPSRAAMRASDKVNVGSITKVLVATGILRLVSQGRLSLDAPVDELLPDLVIYNRWSSESPLVLRHLLDHTSGLDDVRLWQAFSRNASPDSPLRQSIDTPLRLRSRPGTVFSYSTTGYTLLGMVIEKATGERYETYLDRTLLRPLGMADSSFGFVTQTSDPRLAMGHFEDGVPHASVPVHVRPAAQFTTTARDMALFARFLLGDGSLSGKPFIEPQLMRARGRPTGTEAARAGLQIGYALGLAMQERGGVLGLCHGGDTVGYRAMLCLYPEQRKAFFRSVNSDVEGADYRKLDATLIRNLGIPLPVPASAAPMPGDIADWEGIFVPSPSRFEMFAYLDQVLGFMTLVREGGSLELRPFQGEERTLVPIGGHLLRAEDRSSATHVLFDRQGRPVISTDTLSFEKVELRQIVPLWLSLAAGVLGMIIIMVVGLGRVARRSLSVAAPLFLPFLMVLALSIPILLFMTQDFLTIGDVTPASASLAAITAVLPLAAAYGLVRYWQRGIEGGLGWIEVLAMLGVLQWSVVLAAWGLLPLMLWS